jgi:hypothetical protein
LIAGTEKKRYTKEIEINLTGFKTSPILLVDADTYAGNKVIAVTGKMNLYGKVPGTTKTRLTSSAEIG